MTKSSLSEETQQAIQRCRQKTRAAAREAAAQRQQSQGSDPTGLGPDYLRAAALAAKTTGKDANPSQTNQHLPPHLQEDRETD
jgi:hypothetical protein